MSERPSWSLSRASVECAVSLSTLRRALRSERFPDAFKDSSGTWKVPVDDLIAAGFPPKVTKADHGQEHDHVTKVTMVSDYGHDIVKENEELRGQVEKLKSDLEHERAMTKLNEQTNALLKDSLDSLKMSLRMIEGRQAKEHVDMPPSTPASTETSQPHRVPPQHLTRPSLWTGLFGRR